MCRGLPSPTRPSSWLRRPASSAEISAGADGRGRRFRVAIGGASEPETELVSRAIWSPSGHGGVGDSGR